MVKTRSGATSTESVTHLDAIVIGGGVSGIGAAYYLKHRAQKSFVVLEARAKFGGTWDLFKYPGIRTDSDMFTFSLGFHPWRKSKLFATAREILDYLGEVIDTYDLSSHIRYNTKVVAASYDSETTRWTVKTETGEIMTSNFIVAATGYYAYEKGYTPNFPGMEKFEGTIIHTQTWPEDTDLTGQNVVVVGSGATAITLIPELAKDAAHVTMLQRSPTYIAVSPRKHHYFILTKWALRVFGPWFRRFMDWLLPIQYTCLQWLAYHVCKAFPAFMKKMYLSDLRQKFPNSMKHFTPRYNMWDQRLCLAPGGDFFNAYASSKVSIVTDQIDCFTRNTIKLQSEGAAELKPDVVVMATGFHLLFAGNVEVSVDKKVVRPQDSFVYKGLMLSGVPNLFFLAGYTNASWTLKVDKSCKIICDTLAHLDRKGLRSCVPIAPDSLYQSKRQMLDNLSSSYVERARGAMPLQGASFPWNLSQNVLGDLWAGWWNKVDDGFLRFS